MSSTLTRDLSAWFTSHMTPHTAPVAPATTHTCDFYHCPTCDQHLPCAHTRTPLQFATYAVRYLDGRGKPRQREFNTNTAREQFIDRGMDRGTISQILAYSDPQ